MTLPRPRRSVAFALLALGGFFLCATTSRNDGGASRARAQVRDAGGAGAGAASSTDAGVTHEATRPAPATAPAPARQAPAPEAQVRPIRPSASGSPWWQRAISAVGLVLMVVIAWGLSQNRKAFPWRVVLWGTGLQLAFGVFVLKTQAGLTLFSVLNDAITRLLKLTETGTRFIFGPLMDTGFSVALNVLPTIIFFSSLMTVLYHLGVMQRVVQGVAWVMRRTMRTSGSETLCTAANIFVGMTEAPLLVKPFVPRMTQSELMAVMTGGFATIAGGVMAAYVGMLHGVFPEIAGHLIAASVMSAPAALIMAKVMLPEIEASETAGSLRVAVDRPDANVIDAAARGASEGLSLVLNVGAMLLAFLALIALLNWLLGVPALIHNTSVWSDVAAALRTAGVPLPEGCSSPDGAAALATCIDQGVRAGSLSAAGHSAWVPWSMEMLLGYAFWPIAFVMGTPPGDCMAVAQLMGEKTVINEFVAYLHLGEMLQTGGKLEYRSVVIATYALCGFSNFGSIAIQIGGIGGLAPQRRSDLARLGLRAMVAGSLACFMTATVAGMLI